MMSEMLGKSLTSASGELSTDDALKGKTVGLYFSAHWCPPCRGFTPALVETYKKIQAAGKAFEIVFVSSDKDQGAFDEYFGEMPWLAVPFSDREAKTRLSKTYKVQGIPTLVILDESGAIITADGREAVGEDLEGVNFPWKPPTLEEALGDEVMCADGDSSELSDLRAEADVVGLYFSAHWCPPCKSFTPVLGATYEKVLAAGKKMAMIFVSSDRDGGQFKEYFNSMPKGWYAIPPKDKRKEMLSKLFEVQGIPRLVLFDAKSGDIINPNARGAVSADASGANFPWRPPVVRDLSDPEGINDSTCVVAMAEGLSAEAQAALVKELMPLAEEMKQAREEFVFFVGTSSDSAAAQVRALTKLGAPIAAPQLVILDIPDQGGFYTSSATEVTAATVRSFVESYKAKTLERKQLS